MLLLLLLLNDGDVGLLNKAANRSIRNWNQQLFLRQMFLFFTVIPSSWEHLVSRRDGTLYLFFGNSQSFEKQKMSTYLFSDPFILFYTHYFSTTSTSFVVFHSFRFDLTFPSTDLPKHTLVFCFCFVC